MEKEAGKRGGGVGVAPREGALRGWGGFLGEIKARL